MNGQAWYRELIAQGYSEAAAYRRAFPPVVEVVDVFVETSHWCPAEDEFYALLGDPLEMAYGPRE